MSKYFSSSKIKTINSKNYLQIFLHKQYCYEVIQNNDPKQCAEILIEEPNLSDRNSIKPISRILNRYQHKSIAKLKEEIFALSDKEKQVILDRHKEEEEKRQYSTPENNKIQNKENSPEEEINNIKEVIKNLFSQNNDDINYDVDLANIKSFIKNKINREADENNLVSISYEPIVDNNKNLPYLSDKSFLEEDIAIEYISFFLKHIASRELHEALSITT